MSLKKTIFKVFTTNVLQLVSSIVVGFVVPAILSIESYASFKTYTLYLSYIGLLHFGYIDGLFIKYGGKDKNSLNYETLKREHDFLLLMELLVTIVLIIFGIFRQDIVIFLFGITIIPYMLQAFHRYISQATGDFSKYSWIMNLYTLSYAIMNILLAMILKNTNYIYYCLTTIIANLISLLFFEIYFVKKTRKYKFQINHDGLKIIKTGFYIMLGNLSVMGILGIDKWFVKLFFETDDFAYYSFAISMMNIINVLVNAISITFYSYLFKNNNKKKINMLKSDLIVLGAIACSAYFPLSFLVTNFLPKYIPSLSIISITFSIFPYMILINALYVNLYKVNKNEKKYFKVVISMLIIAIIYNTAALFFKSTNAIALATLLTLFTWYVYSSVDLKKIKLKVSDIVYPIVLSVVFLLCSHYLDWIIGLFIYMITFLILTYICNRNVVYSIKEIILKKLKTININKKE